jgi:hypothetical protein
MKGNTLAQGEIIGKEYKCTEKFLKSSPEPAAQFNQTWYKSSLGKGNYKLFK